MKQGSERLFLKSGLIVLAYLTGIGLWVALTNQDMDKHPLAAVKLIVISGAALLIHMAVSALSAAKLFAQKDVKTAKAHLLNFLLIPALGGLLLFGIVLLYDAYLFR